MFGCGVIHSSLVSKGSDFGLAFYVKSHLFGGQLDLLGSNLNSGHFLCDGNSFGYAGKGSDFGLAFYVKSHLFGWQLDLLGINLNSGQGNSLRFDIGDSGYLGGC